VIIVAVCHQEGPWWVVDVPAIEQTTQVQSLDEVEAAVQSLIALRDEDMAAEMEARFDSLDPSHLIRHDRADLDP
jgi:hypothetical protein